MGVCNAPFRISTYLLPHNDRRKCRAGVKTLLHWKIHGYSSLCIDSFVNQRDTNLKIESHKIENYEYVILHEIILPEDE